jgi:hypothetical protein
MNIISLQERLKDFSEQQLVSEMQMPSGQVPQFLLLTELNRRKRMMDQHQADMAQGDQQTVAQDLLAAAGLPAAQAGHMAATMAPQTDMMGNTGAQMAPQPQAPEPATPMTGAPLMMREGGIVALQEGGYIPPAYRRRPPPMPTGEDELFSLTSPLRPQAAPPTNAISPGVTPGGLFSSPLTESARRWVGRADELLSQGRISSAEYDALVRGTAADRNEVIRRVATGGETPVDFAARASTTGEFLREAELPPSAPAVGEPSVPPVVAEAAGDVPASPVGSEPSGGIAALVPPAGGAPAAPTAPGASGTASPGSFEEFLQQRMEQAEADRSRDKWLALAQFGLALMSSEKPTLGGAIGEAGTQALQSLRGSYEDYNKTMMELYGTREQLMMGREQMAMRRAAGSGRGSSPRAMPVGALAALDRQIEYLTAQMGSATTVKAKDDAFTALQNVKAQRDLVNRAFFAQYGLDVGAEGAPDDDYMLN